MKHSYYRIGVRYLQKPLRILQISDVHFSRMTTYEQNIAIIRRVIEAVQLMRPDVIAVTGDLVSRNPGKSGISDAVAFMARLAKMAPVLYTPGNHEMDMSREKRRKLLGLLREQGVCVLCNRSVLFEGVVFSGVVLPRGMYQNPEGGYWNLEECTVETLVKRLGVCYSRPRVLLAHSPMGMDAYAQWGADVVLSGHVHGGIIRLPLVGGVLSPERKFFPKYTKGVYEQEGTSMVVSAGIGKLRIANPAEVVCVDLLPE